MRSILRSIFIRLAAFGFSLLIGSGLALAAGVGEVNRQQGLFFWPPALPDDEAKFLCEEIGRTGWEGLSLEQVLLVAPFQTEALRKADEAGLLKGFVASMLQDKECSEPPADVLAEAQEYGRRFVDLQPSGRESHESD
jgi:hypothetical protein